MGRDRPTYLPILLMLLAADVLSQTNLPPPTTTLSTTQAPPAIVIVNCPTDGVMAYAPRLTAEVLVFWNAPYDQDALVDPITDTPSGTSFGVGVWEVVYRFTNVAGSMAECVFNVTVLPQCSDPADTPCSNGVCVPRSSFCDGYNDCGDSLSGSDEGCPFNGPCTSAAPMLYAVCAYRSGWVNATSANGTPGTSTTFQFHAPSNVTDTTRLISVRVNVVQLVDLLTTELFSATLFMNISLPASSQNERVLAYTMYSEVGENFLEVELRRPLPVQPDEQILVSMEYDDNILTERPPFPVDGTCPGCVALRYGTARPGCGDSMCLDAFYSWKNTISSATLNSDMPCGTAEHTEIIAGLYDSCLDTPDFKFVTPSQSSFIEDRIVLKCIANGPVLPLVEWYNENMEVIASGLGYAVVDIFVSETPQSFTCALDKSVWYEETITVSEWSQECNALHLEAANFPVDSACLMTEMLGGSTFSQDPNNPFSIFTIGLTSAAAYRFSMDASVLNAGPNLPVETGVLLPLRLEMTYAPSRRRRRRVKLEELYSRVYENFYVPPSGRLAFDINPAVPLDPNVQVLVTVSVLEFRPIFGEQPPPPPSTLDVVSCMQSNGSSCEGFLQEWSQVQQDVVDAGCSSNSNRALQAYQTCIGASAAEPRIITPPKSVDVSLMQGADNPQQGLATMTCYIENAVEYSWYKVAPVPGRKFIKSGSTLSFQISGEGGFTDQGSYVCVGKGGTPYENIELETKPATFTVEGFSMFKATASIANRPFTGNLTNPDSQEYMMLSSEVRDQFYLAFYEYAGLSAAIELEVISFSEGSIILDLIIYVGESGILDSELATIFASSILATSSPEQLEFSPDSVTIVSLVSCPVDQVVGLSGDLTFPQTRVGRGSESLEFCPQFTPKAGMARATRECAGNLLSEAYWLEAVVLDCSEGGNVNYLLEDLSNVEVTPDNVDEIAKETVILTSNHTQINTTGIMAVADILGNIVNAGNPSFQVAVDIVMIVNNILQVDEQTYEDLGDDNSPSRIVLALEAYITALQMSGAAGNLTEVQSDIAVFAIIVPQDSLEQGIGFAAVPYGSGPTDSLTEEEVVYYKPGSIPIADVQASIELPPEILNFVTPGDKVPISFFLYLSSKLFRSPKLRAEERPGDKFRRAVGSNIIAATVEGVRIENLPMEANVISAFLPVTVSNPNDTVNGSECVFWDFTLNDGFGDWSTEGCQKVTDTNNQTVCHCDHLTSFAVIVDIYGNQDNIVLSIISKIGCAVSMLALIITIITYLAIKKLRTKRPQQILISFSFALLGLYFVFLVGIEATASGVGCIIVAVLIHYFTLAAIAWMAVEAANMYLLFVKILNANVSHFMIKASIAGWGLPLVVVVVILAVDYTNYENANYCFLRPDYAFYFGQILLIGLVLLFNFVVFTLVMRQLTCARKSISSSTDQSKRQELMRRLTNAICISVLLGLTWVFGLLSLIQTANFVFQVFFCIFNSLQGLMIFILFCLRQKEVRQAWADFLLCRCKKGRAADYSKGAGTRNRDQLESQTQGTVPLTNRSTNSTNTS